MNDMKLFFTYLVLVISLIVGCSNQPGRNSNTFYIDGKYYELTDELLNHYRQSWESGEVRGPFRTVLEENDRRWVMDFISIHQATKQTHCKTLSLLGVRKRIEMVDTINGKTIRAKMFDEEWRIDACGVTKNYRAFNPEGSLNLNIYEIAASPSGFASDEEYDH